MLPQLVDSVKVALGIVPVVAPIPGAAIGAAFAHEIIQICEDVTYQRDQAKAIGRKSLELANVLEEASSTLEGNQALRERVDQARSALEKTHSRARKWASHGRLTQFLHRAEMGKQMNQCTRELDTAVQSFTMGAQIDVARGMDENQKLMELRFVQTQELLVQIAQNQIDLRKYMATLQDGKASELVESGQMALKQMREEWQTLTSASTEPSSALAVIKNVKTDQKYRDMQRGLAKLQEMAAILPPVKILNGEVEKIGDVAIAGGTTCDIWRGAWLGEKEVALKAMRHIKVDDEVAQRRFVREIDLWSKLSNEHILQFYGIVTDLGSHLYIVSPWLKNGGVLEYLKKNPQADKMHLLRGAAEGLRYLHSQGLIHGNTDPSQSNIMVSDSGEALISDFGMAKVIEDMTQTPMSTTIARAGSTRWLAPEIVHGERPSKASDTYSFAMAMIELFTRKAPFPEHKSDAAFIKALTLENATPRRPEGINDLLTDDLWALTVRCWSKDPASRPSMGEVLAILKGGLVASTEPV
ncbi:Tyrosine-protein kinase TXK [Leucoagaricus sp. SymC.cos]|nr:Tyrosine-protein kinase TXK [Leucoagaricus sp. SymC.cos]